MSPFEKALINAILEEYAELPDCDPDEEASSVAAVSLWLNRDTKTVYVQKSPGTAQVFLETPNTKMLVSNF